MGARIITRPSLLLLGAVALSFALLFALSCALVSCGSKSTAPVPAPDGKLGGTVNGKTFTALGQRATRTESTLTVTILNEAAACPSENTPKDGQMRLDLSIPAAAVHAGKYEFGASGIKLATTVVDMKDGPPAFNGHVISDGELWIDAIGDTIRGSLRAGTESTRIEGRFEASLCPPPR